MSVLLRLIQQIGDGRPRSRIAAELALAALPFLLISPGAGGTEVKPPLTVLSSAPLPGLTKMFQRTDGWTGADGAYSIPLAGHITLWTFGDTWIGTIKDGHRVDSTMINNSAAWQNLRDTTGGLQFFWKAGGRKPESLLASDKPKTWVWPGDGALVDGRLYLILNLIRSKPGEPGCFAFQGAAQEIVQVTNPQDKPDSWRIVRRVLPGNMRTLQLGNACFFDGDYLYVYGSYPPAEHGFDKHPLALARISRQKLAQLDMRAWEYWCHRSNQHGGVESCWSSELINPVILFPDAAPEMTVSRLRGISGLIATYLPAGFGPDIVIRHADRPEGPWSEPIRVYHCPEDLKKIMLYSAKAHPELSREDGELVITYCRNTESFEHHITEPEIYLPQGVLVRLQGQRSPVR